MTRVPNVPFRVPVIAASAAAVLLVAGCSGGSSDTNFAGERPNGSFTPSAAPSAAAPATPAARTIQGTVLAQRFAAAAGKARTVSFSVFTSGSQDLSAQGVARSLAGGRKGGDLQVSADSGGDGRIEVIRAGGKVFVKPPGESAQGVWMQVTNSPSDPFRTFYTQLFSGFESTGDVGVTARGIAQMGTFTAAGTEEVDGAKTVKWVAKPPPAKGVALLPRTYQSLGAEALENGRTTVTLWIDGTGLLHRTTTDFAVKGGKPSKALTTYSKWGGAVKLSAPPASQVVRGRPTT